MNTSDKDINRLTKKILKEGMVEPYAGRSEREAAVYPDDGRDCRIVNMLFDSG